MSQSRDAIKDLRIDVRFSNNLIMQRIEAAGFRNLAEFCRAYPKINRTSVYQLVTMKRSPVKKRRAKKDEWVEGARWIEGAEWAKIVIDLAAALCCDPEELFSEATARRRESNRAVIEVSSVAAQQFLASLSRQALPPDVVFNEIEFSEVVEKQLATLTPRESEVIKRRFGFDGQEEETFLEIAQSMSLSPVRIQQIQSKALRKLRHPRRASRLKPFLQEKL